MVQQKIIRHETTWDRGHPSRTKVSSQQVLDAIDRYPKETFTSCDIADFMGIPESEYSVRAAIHWLRRKQIVKIEEEDSIKKKNNKSNSVSVLNVYFRPGQCEVDFSALMGVFCRA